MSILSICNEPSLMNVIRIVVLLINIIKIVIPIVLIVFLMIKIMSAVTKQDQEEVVKTIRSCVPNLIAAVLIFLIPTFVDIVARLSFPNSDYAKCISGISKETINQAYSNKMDELIKIAQASQSYSDYANAKLYLSNIKDAEERKKYEELLDALAAIIDVNDSDNTVCTNTNSYAKVNYNNFKWTTYNKNSGPIKNYVSDTFSSYAIWAPENISDLNGVSLPLIVWYHGSEEFVGKGNANNYIKTGLPQVVSEWESTNLDPIPAIIVAPHGDAGWWAGHKINDVTVEGLVKYAADYYKIDTSKIVFWGHSSGGFGAIEMAWDLKGKVTVSNIITMSSQQTSYKSSEGGKEFYSKIPIKGYGEIEKQKEFFNWIGQPDNFTYYKGETHGKVPRRVLLEDLNNDGVSDVIFWLFGKNEKCDSSSDDNFNPQGDNSKAGITANCTGDYENGIGHARLSVRVTSGTATNYKFINGGAVVQSSSSSSYVDSSILTLLIHPKVTIKSSNGESTTISCNVSHSSYFAYAEKGYYFREKASKDKTDTINNPYPSNRLPYYVHIPKDIKPNEKMPMIIGLHGGYGIGRCIDGNGKEHVATEATQTNHYFKNVYRSSNDRYDINGGKDNDIKAFIITISNNRCSWNSDMYGTMDIIHAMIKLYNIDLDRIVVTGVSQGGAGTLYLGFLEENILYRVEDSNTTLSDIANKYKITESDILKYNKSTDHNIAYSNSANTTLKNGSTLIVRSRGSNDPRSIFSLLVPFSPAHVDYRVGFVQKGGVTPPHTLKTPIWVITSNDEYAKVQEMAKELTTYYSKAGDIRYTVLTKLNDKSYSPDGRTYDEHDTDTAFFNRTGAAKWIINATYGKISVKNNAEISRIESQMGKTFSGVWTP